MRIVVIAVVGLFVHYLAAANVVLHTHLLRGWLNTSEGVLKVDYTSAWSAYPTHVAVRGLSIRYRDSNVQMLVEVERGTAHIDPFAFARRTIRFSKISAEGVAFRIRPMMETIVGNEGRVSAFPPIEGYSDPPVEKRAPKVPIPDDQYKLWTIDLPDITASFREIWTLEYRYRGEGHVTGGFHLKPARELWVSPSVVVMHGGMVSLGERDLIRGGDARVEAQIEPTDVREDGMVAAVHHLTARVVQRGELVTIGSIGATYLPNSKVELDRGAGPIAVDLHLDHGVFQEDSRVTYRADDAVVRVAPLAVTTDVDFVARVEHSAIVAEATNAHAVITPAADVSDVKVLLDLGTADLTGDFAIARLSGAVRAFHVGDLHAWQPIAPANTRFDGGAATVAARADYHSGALDGRIDVALDKTRMTIGTFAFACTGKASSNVESADVERAIAFPGSKVDLHDIALRLAGGHEEGLWLRAQLAKTVITTGSPGADTDITVESGPGDRTVKLFTRMASLPGIAADVTAGTQLDASLHLRVRPHEIALTVLHSKNGALEVRGRVRKRTNAEMTGAFLLKVGPFGTGLDLHDGDVSVVPLAGGGWLDEKLQKR